MKTSKRVLTFILTAILISLTPSCTTPEKTPLNPTPPQTNADTPAAEEPESEPAPEETAEPFDIPPETDELVVYSNSMTRSVLTAAVNIFKDKYPDVEVTYTNISDESYDQLLKTELAAGAGPDIVYTLYNDINDVYKLMLSSIFMNLDSFMENDDSFNKDEYINGVFDSGILNGKRYFAPIDFTAHSALTTQEILDEEGLSLDEIKTFDGYIDSIYNYNQKYSDDPDKSAIYCNIHPDFFESDKLISSFGSTYIDYENSKVTINDTEKDDFCKLMDGIRKIYGMPVVESNIFGLDFKGLIAHTCLYSDSIDVGCGAVVPDACGRLTGAEKTPVIFLPQNPAGSVTGSIYSFTAIPEGANNKLNAYRFMKIMLSDEFQGGEGSDLYYISYCPVRKDSVYKHVTASLDGTEAPEHVKDVEQCAEVMMSVDNAVLIPDQVSSYINKEMTPYFTGQKDYDACFNRLMNVLELYKDE